MKHVMTVTALCAAALIGAGTGLGAADISATESTRAESGYSSYRDDSSYGGSSYYTSSYYTYSPMEWSFENGTLTISGTNMDEFYPDAPPWEMYKEETVSLVIEDGMRNIGSGAFSGFSNLTSVSLPHSVEKIGWSAFEKCTGLTEINLPDRLTTIKDLAFCDCTNLVTISFPEGVRYFYRDAFADTPWLAAQRAENSFVIVNNVLVDAKNCEGDVIVPDGVTAIAGAAFYPFDDDDDAIYPSQKMTSVVIPDSVTEIGEYAFQSCTQLTSAKLPSNLKTLSMGTFKGCTSLETIDIPEKLQEVFMAAFSNTPWLAARQEENPIVIVNNMVIDGKNCEGDVVIPDGVVSIEQYAFHYNLKLTSVDLPDSVKIIRDSAFTACSNMEQITIRNPYCEVETIVHNWNVKDGFIVEGYTNSPAERFSKYHNYIFRSIGELPTEPNYYSSCVDSYSSGMDSYSSGVDSYSSEVDSRVDPTEAPTEKPTAKPTETVLGDIDGSSTVNASDAANVLIAAAVIGAGKDSGLTDAQRTAADVNSDSSINATDAAIILQYAAAVGAGQKDVKITDFVH